VSNENFTVSWSFRNRIDIFKKSIESADATCPKGVDFNLIDASSTESTIRELRLFCNSIENRIVRICESSYRTNLSESWNLGMMLTKNRYVIFASSDTMFLKSGWFEMFKKTAIAGGEYILMVNHSLFCIDKKCIPMFGWFDEGFSIGPHFDVDYMIRASENNIQYRNIQNNGYYFHEDDAETIKKRRIGEISDRLPMHDFTNEDIFKDKWETNWCGWRPAINSGASVLPHPPTHISQVKRKIEEIDAHPLYTKKYKDLL
jgi:hypothetical protein